MEQQHDRRISGPSATLTSPVRLARTAGVLYLVVAVFGAFAQIVRVKVYVPGDAASTAENVVANADLIRLSFMADLVQATFMVFVVMALYRLLRHVNPSAAQVMVVLVAVSVAITCLNMVHQLGAVLVATDPSYATALGADGSQALVLLLLDLQHHGYLVAQIFFGLWLFPLGLLAYRSNLFPKPLGVILMLATAAYLTDVVLQFLAPDLAGAVSPIALIPVVILAEVSMLGYLLTKESRHRVPRTRTSSPVTRSSHPEADSRPRGNTMPRMLTMLKHTYPRRRMCRTGPRADRHRQRQSQRQLGLSPLKQVLAVTWDMDRQR